MKKIGLSFVCVLLMLITASCNNLANENETTTITGEKIKIEAASNVKIKGDIIKPLEKEKYNRYFETTNYELDIKNNYGKLYPYVGISANSEYSNITLYGFCDKNGKIVVDPCYNVNPITYDNKTVYSLSKTIPLSKDDPNYNENEPYLNYKYFSGFLSSNGDWMYENEGYSLHYGETETYGYLFLVYNSDKNCYKIIDIHNNTIIDDLLTYNTENNSYCIMDTQNNTILKEYPTVDTYVYFFENDKSNLVIQVENDTYLYDKNGQYIKTIQNTMNLSESCYPVMDVITEKSAYFDSDGNQLTDYIYTEASYFGYYGLAIYKDGEAWNVINKDFEVVYSVNAEFAYIVSERMLCFARELGTENQILVDMKTGKETPITYANYPSAQYVDSANECITLYLLNEIDKDGNILSYTYNMENIDYIDVVNNYQNVIISYSSYSKNVYAKLDGTPILEIDGYVYDNGNALITYNRNSTTSIYDYDGNMLIEPVGKYFFTIDNNLYCVKKGEYSGIIDEDGNWIIKILCDE